MTDKKDELDGSTCERRHQVFLICDYCGFSYLFLLLKYQNKSCTTILNSYSILEFDSSFFKTAVDSTDDGGRTFSLSLPRTMFSYDVISAKYEI
jgi:hypothetical protein